MTTPTNPTQKLNLFTVNPTLSDLLDLLKKEIFLDLNCHHIATVQSFNSQSQTVSATINYPKTFFNLNPDGTYTPVQVAYPQLVDVPVIVLGGGTCHLTFPITQGDQCLILCNDRNIDAWFQSGQNVPLTSSKTHSLSDGFALVGLNSLATSLANYDGSRAVLANGTTGVGVGTSQVKIFNATNGKLGANFQAFFQAFMVFVNACTGSSTDPVLASAASALVTALNVPVAPSSQGPIPNIEGILE